jgi:Uma2 family endonuclease
MDWVIRRLPEPNLLICPRSLTGVSVPPAEVLLAIEVAHSSLKFDVTTKATLYATLGVREYWVVDAQTLITLVHREPSADGYATATNVPPSEMLIPLLAAPLAIRLADLELS